MSMKLAIVCLAVCAVSAQAAAPPAKTPTSVSINIKTAGDLADACTLSPASKADFARLNFCNGFAQGVLQTNNQNQSGTKVCFPNPAPKRSETMKEFATWVRADASRERAASFPWITGFGVYRSSR